MVEVVFRLLYNALRPITLFLFSGRGFSLLQLIPPPTCGLFPLLKSEFVPLTRQFCPYLWLIFSYKVGIDSSCKAVPPLPKTCIPLIGRSFDFISSPVTPTANMNMYHKSEFANSPY